MRARLHDPGKAPPITIGQAAWLSRRADLGVVEKETREQWKYYLRVILVGVGEQEVLNITSVFVSAFLHSYPACKAHTQYCHLWTARLYHVFPQYISNDTISEKKILNTKYFISVTFV